jgi:MFS family permease
MAASVNSAIAHLKDMGKANRNVRLLFLGSSMNGVASGIFAVVFNLYILGLGLSPEVLGGILSAGPIAQALGSIPMGFLMERIGFKKIFIIIYGVTALGRLLQIATTSVPLIALAAFGGGLAFAGDFVVRLPFLAANSAPEERNNIYSLSSILFSVSMAGGALFAGFAPNFIQSLTGLDLVGTYRLTLLLAGLLAAAGVAPLFLITDQPILNPRKISLAPYLWGMDRFTVQQAVVSLFVGIAIGLTSPFMNIYYVYHLGASREFFGIMSALVILPAMLATALGPLLARRSGSVRAVTILRAMAPAFIILLALTVNPWLGTLGYWGTSALTTMSQPLSFAFAMLVAAPRAKPAAAAWLNVTFWLGNGASAPLAGLFLAQSNYQAPLFIAAAAMLLAAIINEAFFHPIEAALTAAKEAQAHG